uniref:Uncharacterized protein n=1 Tax=Rhizophora mucronata TaxID=61149 RepID=A0A2P2PFK2_RHIMU
MGSLFYWLFMVGFYNLKENNRFQLDRLAMKPGFYLP